MSLLVVGRQVYGDVRGGVLAGRPELRNAKLRKHATRSMKLLGSRSSSASLPIVTSAMAAKSGNVRSCGKGVTCGEKVTAASAVAVSKVPAVSKSSPVAVEPRLRSNTLAIPLASCRC